MIELFINTNDRLLFFRRFIIIDIYFLLDPCYCKLIGVKYVLQSRQPNVQSNYKD